MRVLRRRVGSSVIVLDGKENEYKGIIKSIDKHKVIIEIKNRLKATFLDRLKITLACCVPKGTRFDSIVEKTTELGVERIIPLIARNSVVRLDKDTPKITRWMRIVKNASEQSKRATIPRIDEVTTFRELTSFVKSFDLALLACLKEKSRQLKDVLESSKFKSVLIIIGPEGDFTDEEIGLATKSGCLPVSLGTRTLRVDTAAILSVGVVSLFASKPPRK